MRYLRLIACAGLLMVSMGGLHLEAAEAGTTINVTSAADELNSDGDCSLREAIEAANEDIAVDACPAGSGLDEIVLPGGIYILNIAGGPDVFDLPDNSQGDLDIRADGVTLTGAGSGSTTIQGGPGWDDRILHVSGSGGSTIQGITVKYGHRSVGDRGGGIKNTSSSLTLIDVNFVSNIGYQGGGGLFNDKGATATLTDVDFYDNSCEAAGCDGGGIHNWGSITVTDALLDGNDAGSEGGGLYSEDTSPTGPSNAVLDSVLIKGNTSNLGEGIFNGGDLELRNSLLFNNKANVSMGGNGGGLYSKGPGTTVLENVTISQNQATNSGGGIYHLNQTAFELHNVTITQNHADSSGVGGVKYGGGIYTGSGSMDINSTIIADNRLGGATGVDYSDCYNSSSTFGDKDYNIQGVKSSSVNACDLNGAEGAPGSPFDPMMGFLQDNGGPTRTHALLSGSPAIDAGDPVGCPATDQRGVARPLDGDADGTAVCDIGAYEFEPFELYLPLIMR